LRLHKPLDLVFYHSPSAAKTIPGVPDDLLAAACILLDGRKHLRFHGRIGELASRSFDVGFGLRGRMR